MTYREAVRAALRDEMKKDKNLYLLGEDIGIYGGCFKVTEGLKAEFPEQVIDTPVSEEGFSGLAVGAAAMGMKMVIEVMYADFFTLISDAIVNHAAKMHFMSGGDFSCPLTVRLPFGSGTGHGPQHTQSPEASFLNVPGLKIVAPSTPGAAYFLLREAINDPNPVLFFEHKMLYGTEGSTLKLGSTQPSECQSPVYSATPCPECGSAQPAKHRLKIGEAQILRNGGDITLISYSKGVHTALETAEILSKKGIECTVLDLCTLKPLDKSTILKSVQNTRRVAIVQEADAFGGVADAVSSLIVSDPETFKMLDSAPLVIGGKSVPVPFTPTLESSVVPNVEECAEKILKITACRV